MDTLTKPNTTDHESQVQNLNISHAEPLQLLKKNKNKKKNHMKQMDQRSHVHYTPDIVMEEPVLVEKPVVVEKPVFVQTPVEAPAVKSKPSKNPYGRAFVTHVESERNYKGHNKPGKYPKREYPVNRVPTLFYADHGLAEEETAYHEPEQAEEEPYYEQEVSIQYEQEEPIYYEKVQEKLINYEQDFPEVNFTNIPTVGSKLAIKVTKRNKIHAKKNMTELF